MAYGGQQRKQFDDTNRGILFKNDRKRSDKHPDYRGSLNVGGVDHWLSAWRKDTKNGPALSISIEPKQEARRDSYERSREPERRSGALTGNPNAGWDRGHDEPPFPDEIPDF